MKKFYNIKSQNNTTGIYIYGEIIGGSDKWDESDVTFDDFRNALDTMNNGDTLEMFINSPGGSVTAGLAIYDTINYLKSDVSTVGMGLCASMGAVLLASGAKGKRLCLPNCEIMIHQVLGGAEGKASDIKIHAERILETKKKLNKILASLTSKSVNKINKDTNSDYFLNAHDALNYGLIDSVIG